MVKSTKLPEDIKWERICTTSNTHFYSPEEIRSTLVRFGIDPDSIDPEIIESISRYLPPRWISSLALFKYVPSADEQEYNGRIITYIRIVATITNYQPEPYPALSIISVPSSGVDSWLGSIMPFAEYVTEAYMDEAIEYITKPRDYPCFGALLSVSVSPSIPIATELEENPYFLDFEPKKRELYDLVSDTGGRVSRSLANVNIRKGSGRTENHEVLDIFNGFEVEGNYADIGGKVQVQGQWGTRDITGNEITDIRTTEALEESQQLYSRTTQLSQMNSLLQSFHLGTNRALFLMQPYPHISQPRVTFINGPRELEGVQEIVLVVSCPEKYPDVCFEVDLETAHIAADLNRTDSIGKKIMVAKTFVFTSDTAIESDSTDVPDTKIKFARKAQHFISAEEGYSGYKIVNVEIINKSWTGPDPRTILEDYSAEDIEGLVRPYTKVDFAGSDGNSLIVEALVGWRFEEYTIGSDDYENGTCTVDVKITLEEIIPSIGRKETLFLTGRTLRCCTNVLPSGSRLASTKAPSKAHPHMTSSEGDNTAGLSEYVTYETELEINDAIFKSGIVNKNKLMSANRLSTDICRQLIKSRSDPRRYLPKTISYYETEFFMRKLAKLISPKNIDKKKATIKIQNHVLEQKIKDIYGKDVNAISLFSKPAAELAKSLRISIHDALRLKRHLSPLKIGRLEVHKEKTGKNHKNSYKSNG